MTSNYTIYNASAGAGKTYTLVKNFLSVLLKNKEPEAVKTVLAVTFTNKAANEMKERILSCLKDFSNDDDYIFNKTLQQISIELNIDMTTLHQRAKKNLLYLLHHYSLLSISTIDKFNVRLMKSFSKELGLSHSFGVELDTADYLKQSIDELIDVLGTDNPLADIILDYIFWSFENESGTDIRGKLFTSSNNFLNENHLDRISHISKKNLEDFKNLKQTLYKRLIYSKNQVAELTKEAVSLIESHDLKITDFYQGNNGMGNLFYKLLDEKQLLNINFSSSHYLNFCENEKYTASKSPKEADIQEIAPKLIKTFYQIRELVKRIRIDESVFKNLILIEVQSEINKFLSNKKNDDDVLFLSDVNPMIYKYLQDEPTAFIYEKLGGRYEHYFIDEFQDTSQMQWNNFTPLIDNAKVSDGNSVTLVGDPKQAIYRFRSGKPEILINLISDADKQGITVKTLESNYRSLPNIVDFNNKWYQFLAENMPEIRENPAYKELFGAKAQQKSQKSAGGRVQVSFVPKPDKDLEENELVKQVVEIVEECLKNGFSLKDIALLIREKKHSYAIVEFLMEKGFPILTEEALSVASSSAVKTLISMFKWLDNPKDTEPLARMLYGLNQLGKIKMEDYTTEMLKIKDLNVFEILKYLQSQFGLNIQFKQENHLSFYDFCENLMRKFNFGETEQLYLSAVLDFVLQLEKNGIINLKEFLENWELKGGNLSVRFPDNMNAIRVLTIHKSKGLEFPVVIYPMFKRREKPEPHWLPLDEKLYGGFDQYYTASISHLGEISEEMQKVIDRQKFEKVVDELCIQYVATTRATQQLFLLEEVAENQKETTLLMNFLESRFNENSFELYPEAAKQKIEEKKTEEKIEEEKICWISNDWNDRIKVRTEARKFYSEENKDIQFGNLIHAVLSEILTEKELPTVIRKYVLSGKIEDSQKNELQNLIVSVLENLNLVPYFSDEYNMYNEREILFEGSIYRPDRLAEKNGRFTIIDFKTGAELPKHKKQMEQYTKVMQSFGKEVDTRILVYIDKKNTKIDNF
ncbi:MAG: UvrD-helicase domain-containing protein [Flavobacteriaceae bacterium]|jgi:ATP-dependent exoDNAse (exonuclease V) beta subunit|nr:UvrD-helicase domain-containing protein [Flavobacteriaceae bacterium]